MADIFTKEKRSWIMSRIRGKDTGPEKDVESWLKSRGTGFVKHHKISGTPDFAIPEKKIAIFVDGDFWHGYRKGPKSLSKMKPYWRNKIIRNRKRDRRVNRTLKKDGWKVIRIWEHNIKNHRNTKSAFSLDSLLPASLRTRKPV